MIEVVLASVKRELIREIDTTLDLTTTPAAISAAGRPAAWPKATDDNTNTAKVAGNDKKDDFFGDMNYLKLER